MTYWKNSRFANNASSNNNSHNLASNAANRVSNPSFKPRLEGLVSNTSVPTSSKSFLKSLLDHFVKNNYLSSKQFDSFIKIENQYNPVNDNIIDDLVVWKNEFDDEKKELIKRVCLFYKDQSVKNGQPYYYQRTAESVLNDPNFIPSRSDYNSIMNNKYTKRFLQNSSEPNRFNPGDFVRLNSVALLSSYFHPLLKDGGMVVGIMPRLKNVKGGTLYSILSIMSAELVEIEERYLKFDKQ